MSAPERLKKARASLGKSQKDMAIALGINQRTYENYEKGVNLPSWDACEAVVKLGFNGTWLLTGEGAMKRGEVGEQGAGAVKEVMVANIADLSPIKAAAVSYIKAMADVQVVEVMKYLVPQEKPELHPSDELLQSLSPEGKVKVRAAIEAQIKEIEDAAAKGSSDLRPTGT